MDISKSRVEDAILLIEFFGIYRYVSGRKFEKMSGEELIQRLNILKELYNEDGSINSFHDYAEKHALCLTHVGRHAEAVKIFDAITKDSIKTLLIHDPPDRGSYHSESTANKPGKLGYVGMYQYALACEVLGQIGKAISILSEIIVKIPAKCPPCNLSDIRLHTVEKLIELGVTSICGNDIEEELSETKRYNP